MQILMLSKTATEGFLTSKFLIAQPCVNEDWPITRGRNAHIGPKNVQILTFHCELTAYVNITMIVRDRQYSLRLQIV